VIVRLVRHGGPTVLEDCDVGSGVECSGIDIPGAAAVMPLPVMPLPVMPLPVMPLPCSVVCWQLGYSEFVELSSP